MPEAGPISQRSQRCLSAQVFPRAEFAALHEGVARYADRLRAACGLLGMPQLLLGGSVLSDAIERTVRPRMRVRLVRGEGRGVYT
jgi:hypothetical protein